MKTTQDEAWARLRLRNRAERLALLKAAARDRLRATYAKGMAARGELLALARFDEDAKKRSLQRRAGRGLAIAMADVRERAARR